MLKGTTVKKRQGMCSKIISGAKTYKSGNKYNFNRCENKTLANLR